MSDFVVKDSSIWRNNAAFSAALEVDSSIKIGFVQGSTYNKERGEAVYLVEVLIKGRRVIVPCIHSRRFGGAYNYEDFILQGFNSSEKDRKKFAYSSKAGDAVVIAFLDGNSRSGVILGGISHLSRKQTIKPEDGIQYLSSFNGVEQSINKDGEYTLTFKGLPTNADNLTKAPGSAAIAAAKYDEGIGSSYMKFNKKGGWILSDKAKTDPQSIEVDKEKGQIKLTSGKITVVLDKASQKTTLKAKEVAIESTDKTSIKTKEFKVEASQAVKISGTKVAIGAQGTELIDQICQLIDGLGGISVITPVGPATPLMASPTWALITAIKAKLTAIKGSL